MMDSTRPRRGPTAAGAIVVREPYSFDEIPEAADYWIATLSDPDDNYFQLTSPMSDMGGSTT